MSYRIFILWIASTLAAAAHAGHETIPHSEAGWQVGGVMSLLATGFLLNLGVAFRHHRKVLIATLSLALLPPLAWAFGNYVEITTVGQHREIRSNGIPVHQVEQGRRGNPFSIQAKDYQFQVPLHPKVSGQTTEVGMNLFGVAVDGVPFDPATAEFWGRDRRWNVDAFGADLGIDAHNAHVQPGGAYHYHGLPFSSDHETLAGYAADGFRILNERCQGKVVKSSYLIRQGQRPSGRSGPGGRYDGTYTADYEYRSGHGDLDECNGHTVDGVYHYHLTRQFPNVPRLWRGTPDPSFFKRPPGPHGPNGRRG